MITDSGSNAIGRLLADGLGAYIAVGVGASAPAPGDEALDFEVYRAPVRARSYDAATGTVTYAATIPDSLAMRIAEVGLLTSSAVTAASGIITEFNDELEVWEGGEFVTDGVRVSDTGLRLAVGNAFTDAGNRVAFQGAKLSDALQVAYIGAGGQVEVRFENSPDDYHSFKFTPVNGYNVASVQLRSLERTGSPDLNSSTGIRVLHTGSGNVVLDAIRVRSTMEEESLLVRQRFTQLYTKVEGMPLDIEVPVVVAL